MLHIKTSADAQKQRPGRLMLEPCVSGSVQVSHQMQAQNCQLVSSKQLRPEKGWLCSKLCRSGVLSQRNGRLSVDTCTSVFGSVLLLSLCFTRLRIQWGRVWAQVLHVRIMPKRYDWPCNTQTSNDWKPTCAMRPVRQLLDKCKSAVGLHQRDVMGALDMMRVHSFWSIFSFLTVHPGGCQCACTAPCAFYACPRRARVI